MRCEACSMWALLLAGRALKCAVFSHTGLRRRCDKRGGGELNSLGHSWLRNGYVAAEKEGDYEEELPEFKKLKPDPEEFAEAAAPPYLPTSAAAATAPQGSAMLSEPICLPFRMTVFTDMGLNVDRALVSWQYWLAAPSCRPTAPSMAREERRQLSTAGPCRRVPRRPLLYDRLTCPSCCRRPRRR